MKPFIIYLAEVSVCISLFWIVYELFFKKETFFVFLRAYFLSGILLSFIVPFFQYTYEVIITPQSNNFLINTVAIPEATSFSGKITIWWILTVLYFAGTFIITTYHLVKIRRMFHLSTYGKKNKEDGYILLDTPEIKSSFSIFKFIFINTRKLNATEKNIILQHEIQHVKQYHWIDLCICEILFLFQWFNPIAWKYISYIKSNHEYLADKAVLEKGISVLDYKEVLINQTLQNTIYSFYNSFNYSTSKRLRMMSKKESKKWKKAFIVTLLPLFGVLMWASAEPHYIISSQNNDSAVQDSTVHKNPENQMHRQATQKELLIIDGKEYPSLNSNMLDTVYIESISYLDAQKAIDIYGKKGENGVINIVLKKGFDYSALDNTKPTITPKLIIIDGQRATEEEFSRLNPGEVLSLEVLPNDYSVYGEEGKNGLVVVKTKK